MTTRLPPATGLARAAPAARRLNWSVRPEDVFRSWPPDHPLVGLWSGDDRAGAPRSRWTILAAPVGPPVEVRAVAGPISAGTLLPPLPRVGDGEAEHDDEHDALPPFLGGWIGAIAYGAGRLIEPAARSDPGPRDDRAWPTALWRWCPGALAYDARAGSAGAGEAERGQWWVVGDAGALPALPALRARAAPGIARARPWSLGRLTGSMTRAAYESAAARAVEYIRAGDVFQVNLCHRLSGAFEGSARGLFLALARRARPWFGAYVEGDGADGVRRCVASMSPELFLEFEPRTGLVRTRPMKGTRRAARAADLARSDKDRAELAMIVDLMRNDLGRVCRFGSVRVTEARVVESHGTGRAGAALAQGVATVEGRLREGRGLADLLAACFPPGSVTGAPKVRAMQIIDELEPVQRGAYCGAIGWISACGRSAFSVGIRTACLSGPPGRAPDGCAPPDEMARGSVLDFGVGAGIVADSDPGLEWRETLLKAGALPALARRRGGRGD